MGLKSLFLEMELPPDAQPRPPAEIISHLFDDWLSDFFAPKSLLVVSDGLMTHFGGTGRAVLLSEQPLWPDETIAPKDPLTRCPPGHASALIVEASKQVATLAPDNLCIRVQGALHHRAPGDSAPHWYGRWFTDPPPVLDKLIAIRLEWRGQRRYLEISLPHSGYPITSCGLLLENRISEGVPEVAAANRASIFAALSRAAASFGLQRNEVCWLDDGDYAGLYPDDAASIREHWLPQLYR